MMTGNGQVFGGEVGMKPFSKDLDPQSHDLSPILERDSTSHISAAVFQSAMTSITQHSKAT